MVNMVRVSPSTAEDDPQIQAARQQIALALQNQQQSAGGVAGVPLAQGAGAVQAKYGMGNALLDLANRLAAGYAVGQANRRYEGLKGEQDAKLTAANEAKIAALAPNIKGGQVNVPITLDAVPGAPQKFDPAATLTAALAGQRAPTPNAPTGVDQAVTMNAQGAVPDQENPARAILSSALAGNDPRSTNTLLQGIQLRNALPDPAVVESAAMRKAMWLKSEEDKAATLADRAQGRQDTIADRAQGREDNLALRREIAAGRAADKAQLDAMGDEGLRERAERIVNYEAAPPAGMGSNSPGATKLWKFIKEQEAATGKKYDQTKYNYFNAGRKEFTMGKKSDLIRSLDVARRHIDTLEPMIDALKNGDYRAFNIIGNSLGVQMGETPVTNYEMGANILGKEVEKALVPNGGTGQERIESVSKFGANGSPQSMHQGLDVARKFLGGQFAGLMRQGSASTGWDQARLREELQLPPELSGDAFGIAPAAGHASAGAAPKPYTDPAKEAEYQAYKKAHSGA